MKLLPSILHSLSMRYILPKDMDYLQSKLYTVSDDISSLNLVEGQSSVEYTEASGYAIIAAEANAPKIFGDIAVHGIMHPITLVAVRFYLGNGPLNNQTIAALGKITTPIVIYCPPEDKQKIMEARGALPITIVTRYTSPEDIWFNRELRRLYGDDFWQKHGRAFTRHIRADRVIGASIVWNSKALLTAMVAAVNPYRSEVFQYVDIGGFPLQILEPYEQIQWPGWSKVKQAVSLPGGRILTSRIQKHWFDHQEFEDTWIQSAWFAGRKETVMRYAFKYYLVLFDMVAHNQSIVNDEHVMMQTILRNEYDFQSLTNQLSDWDDYCCGTWRVFAVQLMDDADQKRSKCFCSPSWPLVQTHFTPTEDIIRRAVKNPQFDKSL